ncbi:MAG: hypothetical protein ACRD5J_07375 [Nitrososphaeraceae archaeon]
MSSDNEKTEKKNNKYSKEMTGTNPKLELSSTLMNSLYKFYELIMN